MKDKDDSFYRYGQWITNWHAVLQIILHGPHVYGTHIAYSFDDTVVAIFDQGRGPLRIDGNNTDEFDWQPNDR